MKSYELFPLTAAEKLQQKIIDEFHCPQAVNIGVCMSLQIPLDFKVLETCIRIEYQRCDSLRLRFTRPDGNGEMKQYIIEEDLPEIRHIDFSSFSTEEALAEMNRWTEIPFDRYHSRMNEFIMLTLPDGYHGIYLRIDHLLTDSCGVIAMANDVMELYCHFVFGTALPAPMLSYRDAALKDLEKEADPVRTAKDAAFWEAQAAIGEPIFTSITGPDKLAASRLRHGNPSLRAADRQMTDLRVGQTSYFLEPDACQRLLNFCEAHQVSMTNLLLMGLRTYLSKTNCFEKDISIRNYVSRRTSRLSRKSGGSRIHSFPCRTILEPELSFLDGIRTIQHLQNEVYRHANYDSGKALMAYQNRYHTPEKMTYESISLTYQPIPVQLQNPCLKNIPYHTHWFTNGTAIQELYLTVMNLASGRGMEFYFKYQLAQVSAHDVELLYYYLMRILFTGIEHPEIPIGELMRAV